MERGEARNVVQYINIVYLNLMVGFSETNVNKFCEFGE